MYKKIYYIVKCNYLHVNNYHRFVISYVIHYLYKLQKLMAVSLLKFTYFIKL